MVRGGPATIQEPLRELDETLAAVGGMARAGWDDVYPVGPPEVLFPALQRFCDQLGERCGLERQLVKCAVYCPTDTRPAQMPDVLPLAGEVVEGSFQPGFVCYGIPVGTDAYLAAKLDKKVEEVTERALKATKPMEGERQSLWTILRASLKFQFVYWLGLCYPSDMLPATRRVDSVLMGVMEAVAGQDIPLLEALHDEIACLLFHNAARLCTSDLSFCSFCYWPHDKYLDYTLLKFCSSLLV